MWDKILRSSPSSRWISYCIFLGLCPLLFLGFNYISKNQSYSLLSERIQRDLLLSAEKERREAPNKAVRSHFKEKQGKFVEKHLASLSLLSHERAKIEKTMKKSSFVGNPFLEERLYFLEGEENRLQFTEELLASPPGIQESLLTLARPVELDMQDISEIFKIIEESSLSQAPQFLVVDMHLQKLQGSYLLHLKLLKREFL